MMEKWADRRRITMPSRRSWMTERIKPQVEFSG
jgi:hypothetical protein